MIITIRDADRRVEIETKEDQLDSVMEDIKGLLISWGYAPETVRYYFNETKPEEIHDDSPTAP